MLVFAHRGASSHAPENTLLAMEKALEQQADGIEMDVQQIGNELVIFHDRILSRNSNGTGLVKEHNLKALQALDLGEGQSIPTLWQVLNLVNGQCLLNLEIKDVTDVSLVICNIERAVSELAFNYTDFFISSFDHHFLAKFKALAPHIRIAALTASKPLKYAEFAEQLGAYSVNVDMCCLDENFVQDAKQRGLKIMVYTVDEAKELLKLKEWQVDGVFSNSPANALLVLRG
ncbi:glycerophosphodiester phosphodiesterase family protein [Paraglaciecola sp. L3A3]|uniref:glycerophosphodiester phosphodiesterase n=1 Tax=Paraglaciecola sp. L3A3 TaxID=2686358 RepID=UPI00131CB627|nr:glycerophosphodiester phosphodiesterase family protein [Paraglaciecola sp. L3A3]